MYKTSSLLGAKSVAKSLSKDEARRNRGEHRQAAGASAEGIETKAANAAALISAVDN
jgi:hypothetical protein